MPTDASPAPHPPSVFDATCPARNALELIASKWAILVLTALEDGPVRNGALLRKIGGLSQKMLTQTLKDLECNGLVTRCDHAANLPHVDYALSDLGLSLARMLMQLDHWAEENFPALDAARARYAAQRAGKD
ncbi:helix-turn-helix transcriptional regulator [Acidisoma cellulosilytica]|uniref:Helix-turn-helix transcriptional regulator n=1 Tax=Acidisoma cellulosilyticum TaxID=2802395 RepID=A0A964E1W7_9PROT|nr:helix-turn-helix domain-containing protein [Acidisoma cellulosilyticum]MCB8878669.1 helix-turn-helix transcriptional regulator [Acidisoma cellulosilyticum]